MNRYYTSFNEVLDKKVYPSFEEKVIQTVAEAKEEVPVVEEQKPMAGRGYLKVQVTTASGAIPISGAEVRIESLANQNILTLFTDESGETPFVQLPAPKRVLPLSPENSAKSYSAYNTKVSYPGYYTEENLNVAIFDEVKAIQPVSLSPLGEGEDDGTVRQTDEVQAYPV